MSIFSTAERAPTTRSAGSIVRTLWLLSLVFSLSFPGWARDQGGENLSLRTSDRTVHAVETALRKSSLPANLDKAMPMMQARSSAHILRNPQAMLMALKDPEFAKMVPEAKVLLEHPDVVVEAALQHDAAKLDLRTKSAMRILALTQGMDRRNIPKTVSPESAKVLERAMNDAVHDINVLDDKIMEDTLKKISPNKEFTEAFNSFMKATDLADTHAFRQTEIAGTSGRKLDPPSKWLEKLEKEKPMSPAELKESQLAKKMSVYLEQKNFYRDASKFPSAEEFIKMGVDKDFDQKVKKEFAARARDISTEAKTLRTKNSGVALLKGSSGKTAAVAETVESATPNPASSVAPTPPSNGVTTPPATSATPTAATSAVPTTAVQAAAGGADGVSSLATKAASAATKAGAVVMDDVVKPGLGAVKGTGVVVAGEALVRYSLHPEEGVAAAVTDSLVHGDMVCDTIGCMQFVRECQSLLKLPQETSFKVVFKDDQFGLCVKHFFQKPLQEQAQQRRTDPDFDKFMSQFSPGILAVSCKAENGKTVATVKSLKGKGVFDQHKIVYSRGLPEKIENTKDDDVMDRIVFQRSSPQLLQHCNSSSTCRNYEIEKIKKLRIFPWLNDPKSMPNENLAGRVPADSFKWAIKGQQIAERQASSIRKCCGDKKCESYFNPRTARDGAGHPLPSNGVR